MQDTKKINMVLKP